MNISILSRWFFYTFQPWDFFLLCMPHFFNYFRRFQMPVLLLVLILFLYYRIFLTPFIATILSPETAKSTNIHVPFSFSLIMTSVLLLGMVLSLYTFWFHNMFTLPLWLISTNFGTCSCQYSLTNFNLFISHTLKWNIYIYIYIYIQYRAWWYNMVYSLF